MAALKPVEFNTHGASLLVRLEITSVEWVDAVTSQRHSSTVVVTYRANGRTFSHEQLEQHIRRLASSKHWLPEELAARIASDLAGRLKTHVEVYIRDISYPRMEAKIAAIAEA